MQRTFKNIDIDTVAKVVGRDHPCFEVLDRKEASYNTTSSEYIDLYCQLEEILPVIMQTELLARSVMARLMALQELDFNFLSALLEVEIKLQSRLVDRAWLDEPRVGQRVDMWLKKNR